MRFRGRHRKTTFGENGKNKTIVRRDSEHRIVTPQSKSAALRPADFTQGVPPYDPEKLAKEMIILNRESNEKVRIRVRLTEEENQKLEHDSALCGLSQSEYVRQLCRGIRPKPKPPEVFWQMMSELYQIHSALRECGKYEPSAFGICTEIEQLVLDLQEVI